jgi:uncharacterized protein YndB with AHSA1/START domain
MAKRPEVTVNCTLHSAGGTGEVRLRAVYSVGIEALWRAITEPEQLARWYGVVEGELQVGGEFSAVLHDSGWDGRGRVNGCVPLKRLDVSLWEDEGAEGPVTVELDAVGDETALSIEVGGLPSDFVWAYGAGWHVHLEALAAHLNGREHPDSNARMDELVPIYREMKVAAQ